MSGTIPIPVVRWGEPESVEDACARPIRLCHVAYTVQLLGHGEYFVIIWINLPGGRILVSIFVDIATGTHVKSLLGECMLHMHPDPGVTIQPVFLSCYLDDLAKSALTRVDESIDALSYLPIE
jgi:hypothetical protein